jgi:DNA polymerase-4
MYVDINSCFASIEQLSNPLLQGKAVVVAAYNSERGVILAASKEAKKLGIGTGTRVGEAKKISPKIVVLEPDTQKYRFIHYQLKKILKKYSPVVVAKSIDEFAIDFKGVEGNLIKIAKNIKADIASKIGSWLTVSIGIGPNRFLAKTASNMQKPDGLVEINENNFKEIYQQLDLVKLNGINWRTALRLRLNGIENTWDFYSVSRQKLKSIFCSVLADYWYLRLRGFEVDGKKEAAKKSYSNIYSLKKRAKTRAELEPILYQLCLKSGNKLRRKQRMATGVALWLGLNNGSWNKTGRIKIGMVNGWEIYREAVKLLPKEIKGEVKRVAVSIFDLKPALGLQDDLFGKRSGYVNMTQAADKINDKFGGGTIVPATMISQLKVLDFIGFGQVR